MYTLHPELKSGRDSKFGSSVFGSSETEHCVHCHTMSQLVLMAFLYCCLVTPVLHVRCCHLLHPSHSSPSWRCVTSWLHEIQGYFCSVFIVSNICYGKGYEN